jgi:hypothetical protein
LRERAGTVLIDTPPIRAAVGLCHAAMQDGVELAQVHAGVVHYASTDSFYVFAMRVWSLQLQIPAVLLHWGMSELALSALMSAVMGALAFQALAITALAMGARTSIACAAPGAIFALGLARGGIAYPILPFGTVYTFGSIGLSASVLAVALLSAGALRRGAVLLALLPGLHVGLGLAVWGGVVVIAARSPALRADLRSAWRWFAAGAACVLVSLVVHIWRMPPEPAADAATAPAMTDAILKFWDIHRQWRHIAPIHWLAIVGTGLVVFLIFLFRRRLLTPRQELLPSLVLMLTAAGLALHAVHGWAPSVFPRWVVVSMPGRLANFSLYSAAAMLAGLVERTPPLRSRRPAFVIALTLA